MHHETQFKCLVCKDGKKSKIYSIKFYIEGESNAKKIVVVDNMHYQGFELCVKYPSGIPHTKMKHNIQLEHIS